MQKLSSEKGLSTLHAYISPEVRALTLRTGSESRIEQTWKSFQLKELKLSEKATKSYTVK